VHVHEETSFHMDSPGTVLNRCFEKLPHNDYPNIVCRWIIVGLCRGIPGCPEHRAGDDSTRTWTGTGVCRRFTEGSYVDVRLCPTDFRTGGAQPTFRAEVTCNWRELCHW